MLGIIRCHRVDTERGILFKPDIAVGLKWVAAEHNQPIPCNDGNVTMLDILMKERYLTVNRRRE